MSIFICHMLDIVAAWASLVFAMRDDIHRSVPLPQRWRRVVVACTRDAEEMLRPRLVVKAASGELAKLRPGFLRGLEAELAASERALLPSTAFNPTVVPTYPIEQHLLRECRAIVADRLPARDAVTIGLERALADRVDAVVRELRAKLSLTAGRDCAEVLFRFDAARQAASLREVVRLHVLGEALSRVRPLELDIDAELRGRR